MLCMMKINLLGTHVTLRVLYFLSKNCLNFSQFFGILKNPEKYLFLGSK